MREPTKSFSITTITLLVISVQWTVVNEGANQVRLHNNYNFLAVVNGATVIMHMVNTYFFTLHYFPI